MRRQATVLRSYCRSLGAALLAVALSCLMIWPAAAGAPPAPALPILVYHQIRVGPDGPPDGETVISYERFSVDMEYLHDQGYVTLDMDEVVQFLQGERFPPKVVAIHFDDGWQSAINAVPVLDRYGFKATFWVIGTSVGSDASFMDWPLLQDLDKNPNFEIYSHTMTHPYEDGDTLVDWVAGKTPGKSATDARWELTESKRLLEEKLGHPVPYLAWPAGVFDDVLVEMARQAGYTALVTVVDTMNHPGDDPLRIHRTTINGVCDERAFRDIMADGAYRDCVRLFK